MGRDSWLDGKGYRVMIRWKGLQSHDQTEMVTQVMIRQKGVQSYDRTERVTEVMIRQKGVQRSWSWSKKKDIIEDHVWILNKYFLKRYIIIKKVLLNNHYYIFSEILNIFSFRSSIKKYEHRTNEQSQPNQQYLVNMHSQFIFQAWFGRVHFGLIYV